MYLENISEEAIAEVNIPTGVPRRYDFVVRGARTRGELHVASVSYLGDAAAIAAATHAVAAQAGT
jgi:hypothetical protein